VAQIIGLRPSSCSPMSRPYSGVSRAAFRSHARRPGEPPHFHRGFPAPPLPVRYNGHLVQRDRHLIISAGLGTAHAPVRFMSPAEVVELTIGGAQQQS
jgi:hypothetical protein